MASERPIPDEAAQAVKRLREAAVRWGMKQPSVPLARVLVKAAGVPELLARAVRAEEELEQIDAVLGPYEPPTAQGRRDVVNTLAHNAVTKADLAELEAENVRLSEELERVRGALDDLRAEEMTWCKCIYPAHCDPSKGRCRMRFKPEGSESPGVPSAPSSQPLGQPEQEGMK